MYGNEEQYAQKFKVHKGKINKIFQVFCSCFKKNIYNREGTNKRKHQIKAERVWMHAICQGNIAYFQGKLILVTEKVICDVG